MGSLDVGDLIVVETRDVVYTYVLDTAGDDLRVPFTAGWVVGAEPVNPDPAGVGPREDETELITLTTCAELFHTDDRLVAFGHLVSAKDR
jgi:sortase A